MKEFASESHLYKAQEAEGKEGPLLSGSRHLGGRDLWGLPGKLLTICCLRLKTVDGNCPEILQKCPAFP